MPPPQPRRAWPRVMLTDSRVATPLFDNAPPNPLGGESVQRVIPTRRKVSVPPLKTQAARSARPPLSLASVIVSVPPAPVATLAMLTLLSTIGLAVTVPLPVTSPPGPLIVQR